MAAYGRGLSQQALKRAWREQERQRRLASIPMPHDVLRDLFEFLDDQDAPCDHTLRQTMQFLHARGLDPDRIVPWLQEYGAYCDCEIVNVQSEFGDIVGQ